MKNLSFQLPEALEPTLKYLVGKSGLSQSEYLRELITEKIDADRYGQKEKEIDLTFLFEHYPLSKIAKNPSVKGNYNLVYLLLALQKISGQLDQLIKQGKVRYIASSNMSAWQIVDAEYIAQRHNYERFIGTQTEWNLLQRDVEREIVPACIHHSIGIIPYFPLASGLLTGKYQRNKELPEESRMAKLPAFTYNLNDANFDKVERLTDFAKSKGHSILDLAISWLSRHECVSSVMIGATRAEQIKQNVAALECQLSNEDMNEIDRMFQLPSTPCKSRL